MEKFNTIKKTVRLVDIIAISFILLLCVLPTLYPETKARDFFFSTCQVCKQKSNDFSQCAIDILNRVPERLT